MTSIIIIAIVALLILWAIGVQRRLVKQDELCKNALSQIGVQQSSSWDALTALAELVKSYNEYEFDALMKIIGQRKPVDRSSSPEEVDAQENALRNLAVQVTAVAEQYPALKSNENYTKTMDSVNLYENQVRMSRMVFNDSVTLMNRLVRQFPSSIMAGILGFKEKDYLQVETQKTQMPSMKI